MRLRAEMLTTKGHVTRCMGKVLQVEITQVIFKYRCMTILTKRTVLYGFPDGRLKWNSKDVIVGTEATETVIPVLQFGCKWSTTVALAKEACLFTLSKERGLL